MCGVVGLGGADDVELELGEQLVVVIDQLEVDLDALAHAGIGEALGDAGAVGLVGELLAGLGEVVLAVGVLDVGEQLGALARSGACGGAAGRGWRASLG